MLMLFHMKYIKDRLLFCFTSESGNYKEYILQFSFAYNPGRGPLWPIIVQ